MNILEKHLEVESKCLHDILNMERSEEDEGIKFSVVYWKNHIFRVMNGIEVVFWTSYI